MWNLRHFQLIQLIQKIVIFIFSICCLIKLRFHKFHFQIDAESSLKNKKSFIPKENIF